MAVEAREVLAMARVRAPEELAVQPAPPRKGKQRNNLRAAYCGNAPGAGFCSGTGWLRKLRQKRLAALAASPSSPNLALTLFHVHDLRHLDVPGLDSARHGQNCRPDSLGTRVRDQNHLHDRTYAHDQNRVHEIRALH